MQMLVEVQKYMKRRVRALIIGGDRCLVKLIYLEAFKMKLYCLKKVGVHAGNKAR